MNELKKEITLWRGLVLAISTIIGSGLLGLPGLALEAGDAYAAAGGWMLVCVAAVPLIYIFARLGLRYPSAAGIAKYAEASVGEWGGYAVTTVALGTHTLGIPIVALIGASFARDLFHLPAPAVSLIAVAILVTVTVSNLLGVKVASLVNSASFVVLIAMLCVIIGFNFDFFHGGLVVFEETLLGEADVGYRGVWTASALLFWAFLGWENLSFGLEEYKNPKRTVPIVFWLSYAIVVVLYLFLAMTSVGADIEGVLVRGSSGLTALLSRAPFGNLLILVIILVIVANLNSWVFGFSRLIYSAGRSGILPAFFGKLNQRAIPANTLLCLLAVYTGVTLFQSFFTGLTVSALIMLVNQNFLVLYGISVFAFWKTERGLRRWAGTAASLVSCVFLISGFTWRAVYPAALILIGYLNYRLKKKKRA